MQKPECCVETLCWWCCPTISRSCWACCPVRCRYSPSPSRAGLLYCDETNQWRLRGVLVRVDVLTQSLERCVRTCCSGVPACALLDSTSPRQSPWCFCATARPVQRQPRRHVQLRARGQECYEASARDNAEREQHVRHQGLSAQGRVVADIIIANNIHGLELSNCVVSAVLCRLSSPPPPRCSPPRGAPGPPPSSPLPSPQSCCSTP